MRIFLLSLLFVVGVTACGTLIKENSKQISSQIIENLDEYDLSDSAIEALTIGEQNGTSAFTYVGLCLFSVGSIIFAIVSRNSGLKLIGCGMVAGAVPYVIQSSYFSLIISGFVLIVLLILIYHLWWKVKKIENESSEK